jgi:RNA polymerase primary sigma factor
MSASAHEIPALNGYYRQIRDIPFITYEDEKSHAQRMEAGLWAAERLLCMEEGYERKQPEAFQQDLRTVAAEGEQAKEALRHHTLRLVYWIARKYMRPDNDNLAILQEANLGLERALLRWDYTRGFRFTSYAGDMAAGYIFNYFRAQRTQQAGARYMLYLSKNIGDSDRTVEGNLADDREPESIAPVIAAEQAKELNKALSTLSTLEAQVLRLRYGLGNDIQHEYADIAHVYSTTIEEVEAAEQRALVKLREDPACAPLRDYLLS